MQIPNLHLLLKEAGCGTRVLGGSSASARSIGGTTLSCRKQTSRVRFQILDGLWQVRKPLAVELKLAVAKEVPLLPVKLKGRKAVAAISHNPREVDSPGNRRWSMDDSRIPDVESTIEAVAALLDRPEDGLAAQGDAAQRGRRTCDDPERVFGQMGVDRLPVVGRITRFESQRICPKGLQFR